MRKLIIATCAAIVASIAPLATAEEAKKDAAKAVGRECRTLAGRAVKCRFQQLIYLLPALRLHPLLPC